MLDRYYRILGISDNATLSEIKRAFRTRAKQLHPDVNKSPQAHTEFILLTEAYEYLLNLKTGKIYEGNSTTTKRYETYQRWQDSEAARARHRAEYYAHRRYQDFTSSNYYKKINSVNTILGRILFFIAIVFIFILPIILTVIRGSAGFWISLISIYISLAILMLKNYRDNHPEESE